MGNTNLATKFLKAMNLISQHNIETSSATVTIEGTVKEAVENKAGEYIVALSDTANVTACANAVYATGDRVLLLQPSTENQKYTILYKINANSDVNIFRTQEDIWNRLGGNAIVGLVNKEFNGATGESVITNALQDGYADYIEKSHNLQLQVDFYANLLAAASSWENLNYGIKIKYKYKDLDSGEEEIKIEVFDINSMSGNPFWTANNYLREYITFNIDEKHEFLSIEQILFFWENLSKLENIELKIKDLALYSVTPADVEKGYEALVYINGADRFAATSDNTATVELECRLKYQGLLQDTEDCIFVWAKENPAIDKNDGDFYDSRAGAGWEFLSESDAGDASYALPIARAAAPEQKIKCVVIKEGKILTTSEPIVIKNLNTAFTFDFEIISTEPGSNAKVILTIAEKDGTPFKETVTYKWSRTLASGLYQDIEGTTSSIEVDLSSLAGYAVYKCIIQSDTVYYGEAEISLDMMAVTDEKRVQILGATTFLYNLGGERVAAPSDVENILEVVFFDNDGNIINYKDEGKEESNYEVEWIFPGNGNSLIFVSDAKADTLTKNKVEYSLASTYNITHAQNNTVKVIVTYEDKSYEAIIEMGFLRQGQPGTNGTQYICDIAVNGSFKDWIYVDDYNIGNLSTQLKDIASNQNVPFSGLKYEYKTAENKEWQPIFSNTVINKAAIIRATVEEGNQVFYGYLTLVEKNGDLEWLPDTGFTQVLYSSSHTNPQYAASKFKFNKEVTAASDNNFTIKNIRDTYAIEIEPIAQYDGAAPFILLWVNEKTGESNIKIPLLYTYNRWEYAAINNWDGESVSTEDGWVLAPSAGFGEKNENNQFSGVVLGTREKGDDSEQGIYGYCEGEETFRLDAADGSARFGRPGEGAIEVIPGEKKAIIQGGAYEEGKSGMQINLTTPEIKWGNGNFFVGEDGVAHLRGAVITAKELTDEDGNPLAVTAQYSLVYFTNSAIKPSGDWFKSELSQEEWEALSELPSIPSFNTWYKNTEGIELPLKIGSAKAFPWISQASLTGNKYILTAPQLAASDKIIAEWCKEGNTTLIDGGKIYAGSVSAGLIKTDSIRSFNYKANAGDYEGESSIDVANGVVTDIYEDGAKSLIPNGENGFPAQGTYLDLKNGNFYAPGFRLGEESNIAGWQITNSDIRKTTLNDIIKSYTLNLIDLYPAYTYSHLICKPLKIDTNIEKYTCMLTEKWFQLYFSGIQEDAENEFSFTIYFLNAAGKTIGYSRYTAKLFLSVDTDNIKTFLINLEHEETNIESEDGTILTCVENQLELCKPLTGWPENVTTILMTDSTTNGNIIEDEWDMSFTPLQDFTFTNEEISKLIGEIDIKTRFFTLEEDIEQGIEGQQFQPIHITYNISPSKLEASNLEEYQNLEANLSITEVSFETQDTLILVEENIYFPYQEVILNVENKITPTRGFVTKVGCLLDYENLDTSYMFYVADETNLVDGKPDIKFSVSADGKLFAKDAYIEGTIQGSKIQSNPDKEGNILFSVNSEGYLQANSGIIGKFLISNGNLQGVASETQQKDDSNNIMYNYSRIQIDTIESILSTQEAAIGRRGYIASLTNGSLLCSEYWNGSNVGTTTIKGGSFITSLGEQNSIVLMPTYGIDIKDTINGSLYLHNDEIAMIEGKNENNYWFRIQNQEIELGTETLNVTIFINGRKLTINTLGQLILQ